MWVEHFQRFCTHVKPIWGWRFEGLRLGDIDLNNFAPFDLCKYKQWPLCICIDICVCICIWVGNCIYVFLRVWSLGPLNHFAPFPPCESGRALQSKVADKAHSKTIISQPQKRGIRPDLKICFDDNHCWQKRAFWCWCCCRRETNKLTTKKVGEERRGWKLMLGGWSGCLPSRYTTRMEYKNIHKYRHKWTDTNKNTKVRYVSIESNRAVCVVWYALPLIGTPPYQHFSGWWSHLYHLLVHFLINLFTQPLPIIHLLVYMPAMCFPLL